MNLVYWYKDGKRIRIDTTNKIAVDSFSKKGYGPKKDTPSPKPVPNLREKGK